MISAANCFIDFLRPRLRAISILAVASSLLFSCTEYIAPTCIITEPANGQRFLNHESTTVKVTAEDEDGEVVQVKYYLDDELIKTQDDGPYTHRAALSNANLGDHSVRVVAYDDEGYFSDDEIIIKTGKIPDVETVGVGLVNESSVLLAGRMQNYGDIEVETGFYVSSEPDPKTTGYKVSAGYNREEFIATVAGLVQDKKYYFCTYATTVYGTAYGIEWFFFPRDAYHGTVYDLDENAYKTVLIGEQWWMAENLAVTKFIDGSSIRRAKSHDEWRSSSNYPSYCYYGNSELIYGEKYGVLYNGEAIQFGYICPYGWHIPSDSEWKQLEMYLGMSSETAATTGWRGLDEGSKLKSTGVEFWGDANGDATNASGFTAFPSGKRNSTGIFDDINYRAYYGCSDERNGSLLIRALSADETTINRSVEGIGNGFSIRCVKDREEEEPPGKIIEIPVPKPTPRPMNVFTH